MKIDIHVVQDELTPSGEFRRHRSWSDRTADVVAQSKRIAQKGRGLDYASSLYLVTTVSSSSFFQQMTFGFYEPGGAPVLFDSLDALKEHQLHNDSWLQSPVTVRRYST